MNHRDLKLADGCVWQISARDDRAGQMVRALGEIMQLRADSASRERNTQHLVLASSDQPRALMDALPRAVRAVRCGAPALCAVELTNANDYLRFAQAMQLSTLFGAHAQTRGGALIHGALAARPTMSFRAKREISTSARGISRFARNDIDTDGILLTAPGGTGKTTASNRLPAPWVSLCDDTTLIVRDANGAYWAHPMPTWSRFFQNGKGGNWNVQQAVRLRAIFFLEQAEMDRATPLGAGHAAAALVQSIAQASHLMTRGIDDTFARALRSEWFEVASLLTRHIPSFHLQLTLTGEFWKEIERCLNRQACDG
jgi:hypothetical protein